jgi:ankyrin repeat protein
MGSSVEGLIAWLEGQNFDFQSPEVADIAVAGAHGLADETMVLALIDHGAPLDSEVTNPKYTPTRIVAGVSLMESTIGRGQARLFNELVAAGWIDRVGKETAAQLFAGYAAGCSSALVDAAADAGIDIDEPESPRRRTALAYLGTSSFCGNRQADRVATAKRLLARGANPNRRDVLGHTALYGISNPDMLNLLLAHGAERR